MDVREVMSQARDAMTVKRVFGEPVERNGITVIPVARVMGGVGAGAGTPTDQEEGGGAGAGFGLRATPADVYVIRGETVRWEPALNLNWVILGGQLVAIVLILAISLVVRARAKTSQQPTAG
jgi:uncharacterized spore protein YtfJ